jgi:hypothetical protein
MRLLNINQIELYLVLVLFVELVQGGNLPSKRRSGITPEHQHNRLFAPKVR